MAVIITNRTAVFQGMRVIALICVMFLHAGHPIVAIGLPITFFFVISGFLYKDKGESYKGYLLNKCKKLFPIFWITFVLDFFLNHRVLSWKMIPHFFLVQTYGPVVETGVTEPFYYEYLGVSWFLSCLLFCYILSPFIYSLIERSSQYGILLLLLGVITLMCTLFYFPIPAEYEKWFLYVSPYFRLMEYVAGMLMARILSIAPPCYFAKFQYDWYNFINSLLCVRHIAAYRLLDVGYTEYGNHRVFVYVRISDINQSAWK